MISVFFVGDKNDNNYEEPAIVIARTVGIRLRRCRFPVTSLPESFPWDLLSDRFAGTFGLQRSPACRLTTGCSEPPADFVRRRRDAHFRRYCWSHRSSSPTNAESSGLGKSASGSVRTAADTLDATWLVVPGPLGPLAAPTLAFPDPAYLAGAQFLRLAVLAGNPWPVWSWKAFCGRSCFWA